MLSIAKFVHVSCAQGNIMYQREPSEQCFYVRRFEINGRTLNIGDAEQGPYGPEVLPPNFD